MYIFTYIYIYILETPAVGSCPRLRWGMTHEHDCWVMVMGNGYDGGAWVLVMYRLVGHGA